MPADEQSRSLEAIAGRRATWIAAINTGNSDSFVSVLTDDATWLPWRQPAIHGRDQIQKWLAAPFERFTYEYSVTDVQVRLAGEWAVETACFTTRARARDGAEAPVHRGTYTLLWRFLGPSGWLIERYIDMTGEGSRH